MGSAQLLTTAFYPCGKHGDDLHCYDPDEPRLQIYRIFSAGEGGSTELAEPCMELRGLRQSFLQRAAWLEDVALAGKKEAVGVLLSLHKIGFVDGNHQKFAFWLDVALSTPMRVEYLMGNLLLEKGRVAEAMQRMERAADMGSFEAQLFLGECYEEGSHVGRNMERAKAYYGKALLQNPDTVVDQVALRRLHPDGHGGDASAASSRESAKVIVRMQQAETAYRLGMIYKLERDGRAGACFSRVLAEKPDHEQARYELAMILKQQGEDEKARVHFLHETLAKHGPSQFELGDFYEKHGQLTFAPWHFKQSAEIDWDGKKHARCRLLEIEVRLDGVPGGNVKNQFELGCLLQEMGELDQAERWLEKAAAASWSGRSEAKKHLEEVQAVLYRFWKEDLASS